MRKVARSQWVIPEVLLSQEVLIAKEALSLHLALPAEERQRKRPPLEARIWKARSIRDALFVAFLGKCAYCETPLDSSMDGGVEHFRPTGSAADSRRGRSERPSFEHYCWFAYEWRNLFYACADCNKLKRNLFPVNGPRAAVRSSWEEAENNEQALLINPCRLEPRKHLKFWTDGKVSARNEMGRATVEALSLNRSVLVMARERKFQDCLWMLEEGRKNRAAFDKFRDQLVERAPHVGAAQIFLFDLLTRFAASTGVRRPGFRSLAEDAVGLAMTTSEDQWADLRNLSRSMQRDETELISPILMSDHAPRELFFERKPRTSQLSRLSIRNFKGIVNLDLVLPMEQSGGSDAPCSMLLGENSTGKSTTLQAIALALMGQKMRTRMGVDAEDFLPREVSGWQLNDTVSPEIRLEFDTGEPVTLRIDPLSKQFFGEEEPSVVLFAFGARRFFGSDSLRRNKASTLKSLFDPFFKIQHPGRWLQGLSDVDFDALARAMREILALDDEDKIGRDSDGRLFVQAHGRNTPLERLSDGYRSLMAMVLDVMRGMIDVWGNLESARGIVLVDEIETHLHPRWKLRVMTALRRAMPMVQFVATTHDPLCLRGMRGGEVQVLVRNEQKQIEALTGLPDVRGLRAEQLLTSDYFGLSSTADPGVESALENLALSEGDPSRLAEDSREALRPFQWIGDTPAEQIVNEALKRFIEERPPSADVDRTRVREEAVTDVLQRLRKIQSDRTQ